MMWWALAGAIGSEVLATLALRASDGFRRKAWLLPVATGYVLSFYLLWLTLSLGMPVGIAYGVWTACGGWHWWPSWPGCCSGTRSPGGWGGWVSPSSWRGGC